MGLKQLGILAGTLSLFSAPALGHHSQIMYDGDTEIEMSGTVTEFDWRNPHTWIYVEIEGEDGTVQEWSFESNSTGQLSRVGWDRDSLQPGDEVTAVIHPLKDGTRGGSIVRVVRADGSVLPSGGMPNDAIRGSDAVEE